jgi:predicted transcriptional regulator
LSLFNKKFVNKQIAVTPTSDATRIAAFKEWAADIKSGKIATHSEVSIQGRLAMTPITSLKKRA